MDSLDWSNLPLDILESISKLFDTDLDLLCFRSVCTSWRSSSLPLNHYHHKKSLARFPLHLPVWSSHHHNAATNNKNLQGSFRLTESTIYRLQQADESWLVRLQETTSGKMRVLNLFSNGRIHPFPEMFPKVINLQDFRVTVVARAYHFKYRNVCRYQAFYCYGGYHYNCYSLHDDKTVVLPSSGSSRGSSIKGYAIMSIHSVGKLGFLRSGEKKWTVLDDTWNVLYEDIISYRGGFCVVDEKGKAVLFDTCFNSSEIASALPGGGGHKKILVESSFGDLMLVDRYHKAVWKTGYSNLIVHFKVYKLNIEAKKWEELNCLGDVALFVGEDCSFSISAGDMPGLVGNRIFYKDESFSRSNRNGDEFRGFLGHDIGVFNLEDGSLGPVASYPAYCSLFCPFPKNL